jgi:cholesterol transport system auxiliary component
MKIRIVRAAFVLLTLTVAGCLPTRQESPPAHTYRLSLDLERSEARPSNSQGPILLISAPLAEPGYETTGMVYLKRPYELERYALNQWADQPARMFASLLVSAINRTGYWRAVVPLPSSVRGDFRLDSYGFTLQQEFTQDPSLVRVTVRAQLLDLKELRVVGTRSFETVENASSEDAYGGVLAANRAVARLLDDMAVWLKECMQHSPECNR